MGSINAVSYPLYSDDNAANWHTLKTFSATYAISKIINSPVGVYIATQNEGIFFSSDNGQTWTNISSGITDNTGFADMAVTPTGKLIVTNMTGLFISADNGQTWTEDDYNLPTGAAYYPCEQLNGDLYVIGSDATVYKLIYHTGTWLNIGSFGNYLLSSVKSIYIDDQGNIFIGTSNNVPAADGTLYRSVD